VFERNSPSYTNLPLIKGKGIKGIGLIDYFTAEFGFKLFGGVFGLIV